MIFQKQLTQISPIFMEEIQNQENQDSEYYVHMDMFENSWLMEKSTLKSMTDFLQKLL